MAGARRAPAHPRPARDGLVAGRAALRDPAARWSCCRWPTASWSTARAGPATAWRGSRRWPPAGPLRRRGRRLRAAPAGALAGGDRLDLRPPGAPAVPRPLDRHRGAVRGARRRPGRGQRGPAACITSRGSRRGSGMAVVEPVGGRHGAVERLRRRCFDRPAPRAGRAAARSSRAAPRGTTLIVQLPREARTARSSWVEVTAYVGGRVVQASLDGAGHARATVPRATEARGGPARRDHRDAAGRDPIARGRCSRWPRGYASAGWRARHRERRARGSRSWPTPRRPSRGGGRGDRGRARRSRAAPRAGRLGDDGRIDADRDLPGALAVAPLRDRCRGARCTSGGATTATSRATIHSRTCCRSTGPRLRERASRPVRDRASTRSTWSSGSSRAWRCRPRTSTHRAMRAPSGRAAGPSGSRPRYEDRARDAAGLPTDDAGWPVLDVDPRRDRLRRPRAVGVPRLGAVRLRQPGPAPSRRRRTSSRTSPAISLNPRILAAARAAGRRGARRGQGVDSRRRARQGSRRAALAGPARAPRRGSSGSSTGPLPPSCRPDAG